MIPLSARFAFELYNPSDDMLSKNRLDSLPTKGIIQPTMNLVALCFAPGSLPIFAINHSNYVSASHRLTFVRVPAP